VYGRRAEGQVLQALEWAPIVLLEGARQTGKTVLVRDLIGATRPAAYLTFDDALTLESAHADPQGFVAGLAGRVVLDEVQRTPELFRAIKLVVDADRTPGRFLLTGSANVLLLPKLSDSLAGRMRIVTLWPLSQGEIDGLESRFVEVAFEADTLPLVQGGESRPSLARRIARGGFPEAVGLPEGEPRDGWMSAYVSTLLDRDVRDIANISDRVALPRLLRFLAARSSMQLNVSELSRLTGIPRGSIDRYLSLFTLTFAVRMIPAWAGNVGRRLVKSPKVLMVDSGLCAHLTRVNADQLILDHDRFGPLLETFVGGELLRQASWTSGGIDLMYYRDASGAEVDFVLEDKQGRLVGIEVKSTSNPTIHDFAGLRAFATTVGKRFHRGIVLHTGSSSGSFSDGLWALPVESLWTLGT
jgi:hypothetical protein